VLQRRVGSDEEEGRRASWRRAVLCSGRRAVPKLPKALRGAANQGLESEPLFAWLRRIRLSARTNPTSSKGGVGLP